MVYLFDSFTLSITDVHLKNLKGEIIMALKNKVMSPSEAEDLAAIHLEMARQASGSSSRANMENVITTVGLGVIGSFMGSTAGGVGTVAGLLISIARTSNQAANVSYLTGASMAFNEIASYLRNGNYLAADVQQVWIKYTSVSTRTEFVQGNEYDPGSAYRYLRILTSSGWILD